jgi:hypothetical protein
MMALPLFFSVIALVIVSTTALVIVRNRVRIKNLSDSTRKQTHDAEVSRARGNATISALVNEINTNTENTNTFATRTDKKMEHIEKKTDNTIGNMKNRLSSYQSITNANFMGMNNRMMEEIGRLDATDDILRDKIAMNRKDRIEQDEILGGRITQNTLVHNDFVMNSYTPFVAKTANDFAAVNSNMDRVEASYKREDSLLSERINTNDVDIRKKMENMNSDIGSQIEQVKNNIKDVMLDATEMDGAQFTVFSNMISQQQDHTNTNLNTFFDGDASLFSPNYVTPKNFDEWSQSKYYSDQSKRLRDMQSTINKTEEHIDSINKNAVDIVALKADVQGNSGRLVEFQRNMDLRNSNVDEQIAAINDSMLTGENSFAKLQSDMSSKADIGDVNALSSNLTTHKEDTMTSMQTMQSQVWSNIPAKFQTVNTQIADNAANISGVMENVSDLQTNIAIIQASMASNAAEEDSSEEPAPAPPSDIFLENRPWRSEWEPRVQEMMDSSIQTNNDSFTTTLLATPAFNDKINDLMGAHNNVVKVSELDQLFEARVLPTLQSTRIQSDTAVVNSMTASNVVIGGTLDATDVNVSGDFVVKREGDVDLSLGGIDTQLNQVTANVNSMKGTFESAFDISVEAGFISGSPDINTVNVNKVTVPHNMEIGTSKNLKLSQDLETAEGGFLEVSDFNKIRYRRGPGQYSTLEERLSESRAGASSEDITELISGGRVNHLYTEADPGNDCDVGGNEFNKCKTIGARLASLETSVAGSPGSGGIDITPFDPSSIRTLDLKSITLKANAQQEMSFDTSGLTLNSDVSIAPGKSININSDATINGTLTLNNIDDVEEGINSLNTRVGSLESAAASAPPVSNEPDNYVKDININADKSVLTITKGSGTSGDSSSTINIDQSSPNGYYMGERETKTDSSIDYDAWNFYPYSEFSVGIENQTLNLPKEIVTSIDKTGDMLNINTFNTRTGTKSTTPSIDLNTSSTQSDVLKIGTRLALRANPNNNSILDVCTQDAQGAIASGTCTPLWDHRQAPIPS